MKNIRSIVRSILASAIMLPFISFAQVPEKISYQVEILHDNSRPVANRQVSIKISIQKYIFGMPPKYQNVYIETQAATTNESGIVSVQIGSGSVVDGSLKNINWGEGTYYIQTETDPAGGTNYAIKQRSQIVSVPYALQAQEVEKIHTDATLEGVGNKSHPLKLARQSATKDQVMEWDGSAWKPGVVSTLGSGGVDVKKLGVYIFQTSDKVPFFIPFKELELPRPFDPTKLYILNIEVGWNPKAGDLHPLQYRSLKDGIHYEMEIFPVSEAKGILIYFPDKLDYYFQFGRIVYMYLE